MKNFVIFVLNPENLFSISKQETIFHESIFRPKKSSTLSRRIFFEPVLFYLNTMLKTDWSSNTAMSPYSHLIRPYGLKICSKYLKVSVSPVTFDEEKCVDWIEDFLKILLKGSGLQG